MTRQNGAFGCVIPSVARGLQFPSVRLMNPTTDPWLRSGRQGTEKSSRQENKVTASHTEAISPVSGKIQSKLASAGRVLRLVSNRQRLMLATGIAILLCLTCAGCDGFFVSPSIGSIYITPSTATISTSCTQQLTATAKYSDGSTGTISGSSVGWSSSDDTTATITQGGLVTGVSLGTATMTVSDQGVSATSTIKIGRAH